jgi:hypothetical protein
MTMLVAPSASRNASYQSPPISTPALAGRYRAAICRWSGSGGTVSRLRWSATAASRCYP